MTPVWFDWLSWIACMLFYIGAQVALVTFALVAVDFAQRMLGRWRRRRTR